MRVLFFLAALLIGGTAHAQCVGSLRSDGANPCPDAATVRTNLGAGTGSGTVTSVSAGAGMDFTTITGTGSVEASANTRTSGVSVPICPAGVGCATTGAPDLYPIPFAGKVAANVTPLVACRTSPAGAVTLVIKKWTAGNPASSSTICTTSISTSCAVTQCTSSETSLSAGDSLSIEGTTASADASAVIGVTVPIVRD